MNLQYFADSDGAPNGGESTQKQPPVDPNDNGQGANGQPTRNSNGMQHNNNGDGNSNSGKLFDRKAVRGMISSAIDDFKASTLPDLLEQARVEGEKRAQMTSEQRASADQKAHAEELAKREAELNQREAVSATRDALTKAELPISFAEMLADIDEDKRSQNIEAFNDAFNKAVQASVEKRLAGKRYPGQKVNNGSNQSDTDFAKQLAAKTHPKKPETNFFDNHN